MLPFGKDTVSWRVNMEPVIALGGGRALLLQVLHPSVAAGVDRHSDFARDPFRRGFRTADMMLKLAFADEATSARQATTLRKMHGRVRGETPGGLAYDALDPALLLWVWATLVDVSLRMYERGVRRLDDTDRERYYQEQKEVAYACGVPDGTCPVSYRDFERYFEGVLASELRVTSTATLVAYAGRHPPLPRPFGNIAGAALTLFTAGLLPEAIREELGYRWTPTRERLLRAFLFASRTASAVIPRAIRHAPTRYLIKRKTPLGWWRGRAIVLPQDGVVQPASRREALGSD